MEEACWMFSVCINSDCAQPFCDECCVLLLLQPPPPLRAPLTPFTVSQRVAAQMSRDINTALTMLCVYTARSSPEGGAEKEGVCVGCPCAVWCQPPWWEPARQGMHHLFARLFLSVGADGFVGHPTLSSSVCVKLSTDVVCFAVHGALLPHPVSASVPCPPQGRVLCSSPIFLHPFIPGPRLSNAAVQRKAHCCLFWQLLEYGATPTLSALHFRTFFFKRCGIFFYYFFFIKIVSSKNAS